MTFKTYLQTQINEQSAMGDDAFAMRIIEAEITDRDDYRTLAVRYVGDPVVGDSFQRLWDSYENELDRQNYEAEQTLYEKGEDFD